MLLAIILSAVLNYYPPVNYEISLAGNFCEPRANHFHGGVDIKTGGVEGKAILAIADGYVSRIVFGLYGYGCAVYVHHPDGKTSMYCHLKKLHPNIAALLRKYQYRQQTESIDVKLQPYECSISAGQVIAMSGNTGASRAPHLHMEVYEGGSGNAIDALDLLAPHIKDTTPPMAHAFMAYPMEGEGVFCGTSRKQSFRIGSQPKRFTAWGKVGFGVWANDYMDNTYNRYGVRKTTLTVDGQQVFCADMQVLSPTDNRWMNHQGDYDFYRRTGVWYMRAYADKGVNITALQFDDDRGVVDFCEERDYNVVFTIADFAGNKREYSFVVAGRKTDLSHKGRRSNLLKMARYDQISTLSFGDAMLTIKPQSLPYDITLVPTTKQRADALSLQYCFYDRPMPLARWAKLSLKCTKGVKNTDKLFLKNAATTAYCKSFYKDGTVTGFVRDIGQPYIIAYDESAPIVQPIAEQRWTAQKMVRLNVFDRGSGLKWWKAYIDDDFILMQKVPKTSMFACDLRKTPTVPLHRQRTLKVVVSDNTNNICTYTTHIIY